MRVVKHGGKKKTYRSRTSRARCIIHKYIYTYTTASSNIYRGRRLKAPIGRLGEDKSFKNTEVSPNPCRRIAQLWVLISPYDIIYMYTHTRSNVYGTDICMYSYNKRVLRTEYKLVLYIRWRARVQASVCVCARVRVRVCVQCACCAVRYRARLPPKRVMKNVFSEGVLGKTPPHRVRPRPRTPAYRRRPTAAAAQHRVQAHNTSCIIHTARANTGPPPYQPYD